MESEPPQSTVQVVLAGSRLRAIKPVCVSLEGDIHSAWNSRQSTLKLSEYPRACRKSVLPVLQWYRYCLRCDPLSLRLPCGYGPPQARPLQMLSEVFIEDTRSCSNLFLGFRAIGLALESARSSGLFLVFRTELHSSFLAVDTLPLETLPVYPNSPCPSRKPARPIGYQGSFVESVTAYK